MVVYPNPSNPPLGHVTPSQRDRATVELIEHFAENGIQITYIGEEAVTLNLRYLANTHGVQGGKAALYSALNELNAVRVDVDEADICYVMGRDLFSVAVTEGLHDGDARITRLLSSVSPDELFDNLDRCASLVASTPRDENEWVNSQHEMAARGTLFQYGLINDFQDPYAFLEAPDPYALPDLPNYEPADIAPWRSPWDMDGGR